MTRPKNPADKEKEARLQQAIAAVLNKETTAYKAIHDFDVPKQTLYDRLQGKPPRNLAQETNQILTHAEEKELVKWITRLTYTGYPPRYVTLREMAEEIRKRRVKLINNNGMQLIDEFDPIGQQWVQRFLSRHTELSSVTLRST